MNGFFFRSQQVASCEFFCQGWLMNSYPADGCDNARDQFQAFCLENKIKLDPKKWQISNRQVRVRNPQNRNVTITTQALWIDCTSDMARYKRHDVHLLRPSYLSDSSYSLLYKSLLRACTTISRIWASGAVRVRQNAEKIVDGRFMLKRMVRRSRENLTVYAFLDVLEFSDRKMPLNDFYGNTHVLPSTEVGY